MRPTISAERASGTGQTAIAASTAHRDEVEGLLIASMPTANGARPHITKIKLPVRVGRLLKKRRELGE